MRRAVVLFLSAGLAAGCGGPDVDVAVELTALRAAAVEYHTAASEKDAQRVVSLYDRTAVMVPPNAALVEGIEGVREYRFGFIETPGVELSFEIVRAEVSASGDMGWTLSVGQIAINRADGPPGRDVVRDFHTWRKQTDGSWKVVADVWNSGLPVDG